MFLNRFIRWIESFFKEYTLEEIVEESKTFKPGMEYGFVLKHALSFEERNVLLPQAVLRTNPSLRVSFIYDGALELTCVVTKR